jgi:hypothetical protein
MGHAITEPQIRTFVRQSCSKSDVLQLTWFSLEAELQIHEGDREPRVSRRTFTNYQALAEYVLLVTEQAMAHGYAPVTRLSQSSSQGSAQGPSAVASTLQPGAAPGESRASLDPWSDTSASRS